MFRGGQVATQALVSGDPPIVNIGTVVQATIQGHNVVLVAAVENKYDLIVFTRPGITQLEQLRGKRIGITGFNSATHYASIIVARHINADIERIDPDPGGSRHRAHRQCHHRRARCDLRRHFGRAAGAQGGPDGNCFGRRSRRRSARQRLRHFARLYREQPRHVKNALKGFVEAIYFVYANKKETQNVFAKYMRTNNPEVLEDSYNGYIKSIPKKPYPTLKGIQFMLDVLAPTLPQAKNFKPEQFVDLSFLAGI